MAHNAFAIRNPTTNELTGRVPRLLRRRGDGRPEAYANYGDATVTLRSPWTRSSSSSPLRGGGMDTNCRR